jgi:hypothetical protein
MWTNKMGGNLEEGDPGLTKFTIEGRVDVKELGGHMRVFFSDIIIKPRLFVLTEAIRTKLLEDYYEEKKRKKQEAYNLNPFGDNDSESDDDLDPEEKKKKDDAILQGLVEIEKRKPTEVPKLHLFLTGKKPKVRMVDAHTSGTKLRLTGFKDSDGVFGNEFQVNRYEASLTDIPDALSYQGLVVLKLPENEPKTAEPLIYGIVKLQSYRSQKVRTSDALQLSEISEMLTKILSKKTDHTEQEAAEKEKQKKQQQQKEAEAGSRVGSPNGSSTERELTVPKEVHDKVKPLHVYRQIASKVWLDFQKPQDEEIDFETFLTFIDHIDLFMVTMQAKRVFDAVDGNSDGKVGMSEFENFLIANDILGGSGVDLVVMDVFDSLKSLPVALALRQKEQAEKKKQKEEEEAKQKKLDEAAKKAKQAQELEGISTDPFASLSSPKEGGGSGHNSSMSATSMVAAISAASSAAKLAAKVAAASASNAAAALALEAEKVAQKIKYQEGLDFSAFTEAIQLLGVREEDDDIIREAFCFGGGITEKDADKKYLTLQEFRKGWLKLANVEAEMQTRGLKYEQGVFADSRNRERLTRALTQVEDGYLRNLSRINGVVNRIKQERRQKKDQKRRDQEAHHEKLMHEANKFMAVRAQEKRIKLKREQEEKSKKRLEDKVLRNKLQLRQQENLALQRLEISEQNKKNERLRQDEIRSLGLDQLDYSVQKLRAVPEHLYHTPEARGRLIYVLSADFSHNILDSLPGEDFLYWLSEVRMFKLSENRLKVLPEQIRQLMNLEILEINTNRLEYIPDSLCQITSLQRLDLANNHLESLPEDFGNCRLLKYVALHSNHLSFLPRSLGDCTKLAYLDLSRNKLVELPESMQVSMYLLCARTYTLQLHFYFFQLLNCATFCLFNCVNRVWCR